MIEILFLIENLHNLLNHFWIIWSTYWFLETRWDNLNYPNIVFDTSLLLRTFIIWLCSKHRRSRSNSVHYNLSAIKTSKSFTIRESKLFCIYHPATNFRNNIWQNVKFWQMKNIIIFILFHRKYWFSVWCGWWCTSTEQCLAGVVMVTHFT